MKKKHKDEVQKERRNFLKKSAYSAPKLIAMGYLISTNQASADCDPFSDPNCNGVSGPVAFLDQKIHKKMKKEESEIV